MKKFTNWQNLVELKPQPSLNLGHILSPGGHIAKETWDDLSYGLCKLTMEEEEQKKKFREAFYKAATED